MLYVAAVCHRTGDKRPLISSFANGPEQSLNFLLRTITDEREVKDILASWSSLILNDEVSSNSIMKRARSTHSSNKTVN